MIFLLHFCQFCHFLIESSVVCTHFDENNDNFIQIRGNWQDYGNQSCYLQDEQNSNTIDKGKLYNIHIIYSSFQKDDITIRFRLLHLHQISWTEFAVQTVQAVHNNDFYFSVGWLEFSQGLSCSWDLGNRFRNYESWIFMIFFSRRLFDQKAFLLQWHKAK